MQRSIVVRRNRRHAALFVSLAMLIVAVTLTAAAKHTPRVGDDVSAVLAPLGFTPDDIRRVQAGRIVSRSLPADDGREVATAGVVRVNVAPDEYVRRLADIARFKQADAVLQIGTFSNPPNTSDVDGLTLEAAEVERLRDCRVGDCAIQLPASIIDALHRTVNWNDASASRRATEIIRSGLVRYVQDYLATGRQDGMVYVDQSRPVSVSAEFRDLVNSDRYVLDRFPDLRQYLLDPTFSPPLRDVIYWSKEKIAGKAVISVTHLVIAPQSNTSALAYIAASKQLYGSHYFDSSLGLTLVIRDGSDQARSLVAYVNRSRVDAIGGFLGGIKRRIVRSKARGALAGLLEHMKRRLDAAR